MPRISRTVLPRIRKSIEERGVLVTLARSVLLPAHLLKEYRASRELRRERPVSDFDLVHRVDTEGDFQGWTYLSDLQIASTNWIHGNNYAAIEPERFHALMAALPIRFEELTFIDYGSGKGRALFLASEYPFHKIIGLEFSPELHETALDNVRRYKSEGQKCRGIEPCLTDFVEYELPPGPLFLFFFDPCDATLFQRTLKQIEQSLRKLPRLVYLAYVGPRSLNLEPMGDCLKALIKDTARQFAVFKVG